MQAAHRTLFDAGDALHSQVPVGKVTFNIGFEAILLEQTEVIRQMAARDCLLSIESSAFIKHHLYKSIAHQIWADTDIGQNV